MPPLLAFITFLLTSAFGIATLPSPSLPAFVQANEAPGAVAVRLQARIERDMHVAIPIDNVVSAMRLRDRLLRTLITVSFQSDDQNASGAPAAWTLRLADHPEWIAMQVDRSSIAFALDEKQIANAIESALPASFPRAEDASALRGGNNPNRLIVSGMPHAGFTINTIDAASRIAKAINARNVSVTVPVAYDPGFLYVQTDNGIQKLTKLSTGRSNFAGSTPGRSANVVKALSLLNGAVMRSDHVFSFNAALADGDGWYNSLVIVNGGDLVEAPGGGICQAATTTFRAAVLAGLPVPVRANHSLYVSHYQDYGVGIDATVMAPAQDLKIADDTGNPIVILARNDGDDAYVDFYGVPDGRRVALDGPYFGKTASQTLLFDGSALHINEIGWKESVQYADGRVQNVDIVSRYNALPRTLASQYPVPRGKAELETLNETGSDIASL
ncbi:MAG TPA: VanW family protein [Candidatus Peribacteraceae bacterium]|nr:VanW family protein [Candidatus Peribacteraceae bacterium]